MTTTPGVTPPDLDNPDLFECRPGVPILDVHTRGDWVVDADRLDLLCRNSNERAARGEFGLMLLGHTTDGGAEKDQPPVVGYMRNYRMGEHAGAPCALADLHYDKADAARLMKNYPRRSVEAYYSDTRPEQNYLDSVALLVRPSARDLGFVTYSKEKERAKERYALDLDPDAGPDPAVAGGAFVTRDDLARAFEQLLAKVQPPAPDPAPVVPAPAPEPIPAPSPPEPAPMPVPDNTSALAAINAAVAALQSVATALAPVADEPAAVAEEDKPVEVPAADEPAAADADLARMGKGQDAALQRYKKEADAKATALQQEIAVLKRYNLRIERKADLEGLRNEGFVFADFDAELAEVVEMAAEKYAKYPDKVRANYRQTAVGDPLIATDAAPPARKPADPDALTPADYPKIASVMEQYKLDYPTALERYKSDRTAARG